MLYYIIAILVLYILYILYTIFDKFAQIEEKFVQNEKIAQIKENFAQNVTTDDIGNVTINGNVAIGGSLKIGNTTINKDGSININDRNINLSNGTINFNNGSINLKRSNITFHRDNGSGGFAQLQAVDNDALRMVQWYPNQHSGWTDIRSWHSGGKGINV